MALMTIGNRTPHISAEAIADFERAELDIKAILEWANVGEAIQRRRRIEVANRLPLLVPMLVFDPDDLWSQDLAAQIDSGVPILECLEEVFPSKGPEWSGVLVNKPLALLGDWSDDVLGLMLAMECLEVDALPKTEADWRTFSEYAKALHPCDSLLCGHVFRGLWCQNDPAVHRTVQAMTSNDLSRLALVNDYCQYLGQWYADQLQRAPSDRTSLSGQYKGLPSGSEERNDAGAELADGRLRQFSAVEILAQALRWEEVVRQEAVDAHVNSDDPQWVQWPPLFEAPVTEGEFTLVSLTSATEVASEFARLGLGVDSLLSRCAAGERHAVALRDRDGVTRTVAEIWIDRTEDGWYVAHEMRHRGKCGRHAYQAEVDALDGALKRFWGRVPQEKLAQLVRYHDSGRPNVEQALAAIPFQCDVMARTLGRVLPIELLAI